jgi:hypothetical protein
LARLFLLMSVFPEWSCVRMRLQKANKKKFKLKTTHLNIRQSNQTSGRLFLNERNESKWSILSPVKCGQMWT